MIVPAAAEPAADSPVAAVSESASRSRSDAGDQPNEALANEKDNTCKSAAGLTAAFREYSDGFADKILQMIAYIIVKVP